MCTIFKTHLERFFAGVFSISFAYSFFFLHNRRLARLDKKNDDRLTEYFKDFMAMCRRVCGRPLEEDSERGANVEAISEERASRCLFRILLLSRIREEV